MPRPIAIAKLVRWLGPWAGTRAPSRVVRTTEQLAERVRAHVYRAAHGAPIGVYVLVAGLHYLGPDDPRFDRFARIVANAGFLAIAPHLPDHLALRVAERATDDLALAFDRAESIAREHALAKPALFSISFGALPATTLAARDDYAHRVGALVLFGGYADFHASVRFALTGRARDETGGRELVMAHDPLNAPVVWLHLLPSFDVTCDKDAVARAWRAMVERTWGQEAMKAPGARDAIAHDIAKSLGDAERAMFLTGCGLCAVDDAKLEAAFAHAARSLGFADLRAVLARVKAPVVVVHGKDDDVIPWFEAEKIRASVAPGHRHRVLITGMYGHSGASLPSPRALARELRTMMDVVRAMVAAPTGGL